MSGDEAGSYTLFLKNAIGCNRSREDGRLSDLRELELVFRTLETELRDLVSESFVGFVECLFGYRIVGGEFFAHANCLGALSGKKKCKIVHRSLFQHEEGDFTTETV